MDRIPGDEEEAEEREFLHGFDRIEQRIARRGQQERRVKYAKAGAVVVAAIVGVALITGLAVGARKASSKPYECRSGAVGDSEGASYELTFFVIGDWGRLGSGDQRTTARMMADAADCMRPDFILSTGDNFYKHGLRSANDEQFLESFVNVYSAPSLQGVPWYAVLGNHDYNDGINPKKNDDCAALSLDACPMGCCYSPVWQYTGRANDARWHASNGSWAVPGLPPGLAEVIMLDTSPFITRYMKKDWAANAGGLLAQNATQVRLQLQALLEAPPPAWRFVVGHHPVASFGEHCDFAAEGDCTEMAWLAPLLQSSGVAAYFSGHDHDMQLVARPADPGDPAGPHVWPLFVVSGGGSQVRTGEMSFYKAKPGYALPFFSDDQGFAAVRVNRTHAVLDVYVSNHLLPAATRVLAAADRPAAGGSGGARSSGGGGGVGGADTAATRGRGAIPPGTEGGSGGGGEGGAPGALPAATTHGPGGRRRRQLLRVTR